MKRIYLLPESGTFYKANLHCHSTLSDGRFSPEKLRDIYKAHGYQVIAYSDHNTLLSHMDLAQPDFLPITSIEIDYNCSDPQFPYNPVYHLNFFSKDPYREDFIPFERIYSLEKVQETIDKANDSGFLVQYNHPRWSFQSGEDFCPLTGLFAFEVYNHGCEKEMMDGYGDYEYERYLQSGKLCACTATDDNHNFSQDISSPYNDSFGGFTMIKAPDLSYKSIISAMENLDLYASTGPVINQLYVENNTLYIECEPCCAIMLRTDSRLTRILREHTSKLTSADFSLDFPYKYIRVELMDEKRNKAMTRAYTYNEINKNI